MAYVGEYRERLRDGHGSYVFPGASFRYEGDWKRGKMHGHGVFTLPDGGSYEGEFVDGEIHGIGLRRWVDGSTYNGQFHRGERHGEGVYIAPNGEVYEGHWVDNQRHGLGELRMPHGDVYRGDFHRHKQHGNGRIKFARDGSWYDGDWAQGTICGRGTLKDAHGVTAYEGEWFNGQRCGRGAGLISCGSGTASAITYDGVWAENKPMAPTVKLGFRAIQPRNATADSNDTSEVDYQEAPSVITLDKKLGCGLPKLAVASLHVSAANPDAIIVRAESSRRLRLRLFEGIVSSAPAAPQAGEPTGEGDTPHPPVQCQLAVVREPALASAERQGTVDEAIASSSEGELEVAGRLEECADEVVLVNSGGVAVLDRLAMPASSPVGTYHLVCDNSLDGDDVAPIYLTLQLIET